MNLVQITIWEHLWEDVKPMNALETVECYPYDVFNLIEDLHSKYKYIFGELMFTFKKI